MKKFYIDYTRIYDEGYGLNISPIDGRKYYEDKVGIRLHCKGKFIDDWWIKPQFNKITIESTLLRHLFICESIIDDDKFYSIILDDQRVLFDKVTGVRRIEDTDIFLINDGENNSTLKFLRNGNYEINNTSFHSIIKLHDKLIDQFRLILSEKVSYLGIIKQKNNLNHLSSIDSYYFLDIDFNINVNIQNLNAGSLLKDYRSNVEYLIFKHKESTFKFLYTPQNGIINKKLSYEIEYLGGNLYKIRSIDNTWDIIDSFGSEYASTLDSIECHLGDIAGNIIFCKAGQYGAMDISGEIYNIPLGDKLTPHQNSHGAISGYIQRNSSVFDILGNTYEVSFPSYLGNTISDYKPIIDDQSYSDPIGGGLYCIHSSWDPLGKNDGTSNYSYVVNRCGKIIKEKRGGDYIQFFDGLFVFCTNEGIYQIINREDNVIFSSDTKIRIIEIPNNPIFAVEKKEVSTHHSKNTLELYNQKGERIFKEVDNICDVRPFRRGNILLGLEGEATYSYPVTIPLFDRDEDGNSYCEEYHTWDANTKEITLWGLFDINGKEILTRDYFDIEDDDAFNLIKIIKICGEAGRGFFHIYGYSDYLGNILLEPSFESIEIFTDSLLRVKIGKRYGFLDYAFKQVMPCRYETLEILDDGGKTGIINRLKKFPYFKTENGILSPTGLLIGQSGKAQILLPRRFCQISDFTNGIAWVCSDSESTLRYGLVNHYGQLVVEDKYLKIEPITDTIYKCKSQYGAMHEFDLYLITKNLKATIIGSFDFVSIPSDYSIGVGKRLNPETRDITYGIIDLEGRPILDICSATLGTEVGEYRTIAIANKVGFVHTRTKRVVLIADANYIGPLHNGVASFAIGTDVDTRTNRINGGKWGAVNNYGEEIIPPIYSKIFTDEYGRIYFKNGTSKIGMINKDKQIIIPDEYDFLHDDTDENQITLVKKSSLYSCKGTKYNFNNDGILLNTEEYDERYDW